MGAAASTSSPRGGSKTEQTSEHAAFTSTVTSQAQAEQAFPTAADTSQNNFARATSNAHWNLPITKRAREGAWRQHTQSETAQALNEKLLELCQQRCPNERPGAKLTAETKRSLKGARQPTSDPGVPVDHWHLSGLAVARLYQQNEGTNARGRAAHRAPGTPFPLSFYLYTPFFLYLPSFSTLLHSVHPFVMHTFLRYPPPLSPPSVCIPSLILYPSLMLLSPSFPPSSSGMFFA
jgi:hypothetical protein